MRKQLSPEERVSSLRELTRESVVKLVADVELDTEMRFARQAQGSNPLDWKHYGTLLRRLDDQPEEFWIAFVGRDKLLGPLLDDYYEMAFDANCDQHTLSAIRRMQQRLADYQLNNECEFPSALIAECP
jgi:hypothetical protein